LGVGNFSIYTKGCLCWVGLKNAEIIWA